MESPSEIVTAFLAKHTLDPLGFVRRAFPWGRGELAAFDGPDAWQADVLEDIGRKLRDGMSRQSAIREAVASGHGIGKSALVAWIILWAVSTCPDTKGVVTANTENQLKTKTWAEVAKWFRLFHAKGAFILTATALFSAIPGHDKTWRVDMVAWSENRSEAFAGLHNKGKRVLLIYDEASAIPDTIWEVSEGALTDENTEIIWCVFGNPTKNTGRFRECFGKFKHRWTTRQIDSRTAAMTNKEQIKAWIEDNGEDSDFVKVRVRGVFPSAGSNQFIPSDVVEAARGRTLRPDQYSRMPKVVGVDVARFGGDQTVITKRQGLYCHPQLKFRKIDTMTLVGIVADICQEWRPDAVFVDGCGVGAGVVDRLHQLGYYYVVDAQAGARALNPSKYVNRRAEMWAKMRDWMKDGGSIPDDPELESDLTGIEYSYSSTEAIQLEKKDDMKKRGLSSPDCGDSLALSFFRPVTTDDDAYEAQARINQKKWDPFCGW